MRISILALLITLAGCAGMPTPGEGENAGGPFGGLGAALGGVAATVGGLELGKLAETGENLSCGARYVTGWEACMRARDLQRTADGIEEASELWLKDE